MTPAGGSTTATSLLRDPLWTGWIDTWASLMSQPHERPGCDELVPQASPARVRLDIAVRIDTVSFWTGSRTLAVVDRGRLQRWIRSPFQPMTRHDLQFLLKDRQLCLLIDQDGPYALATEAVARLVQEL